MAINTQPLVTIVVPSFNQGHFIEDTLKSILNQDYLNIEIVVFDGGSSDGTVAVLEKYKDRITYTSKPDNGQSDAVNKGFGAARGEIIGWLNSDDVYPDRRAVSRMVAAFDRYPEADFIYGDFIEIDERNNVLRMYRRPGFSFQRLLRIGYISQPATFFRKKVVDQISVREDLTFAMDTEYWLRAHSLGFRFQHINVLIAAERLHSDAKCVMSTDDMVAEARKVRVGYGGTFGYFYPARRFLDRILLYACRLTGVSELSAMRSHPESLTIPMKLDGAIRRTLQPRSQ